MKPIPIPCWQLLPVCTTWDLRKVLPANFEKNSINYMEVNIKSLT